MSRGEQHGARDRRSKISSYLDTRFIRSSPCPFWKVLALNRLAEPPHALSPGGAALLACGCHAPSKGRRAYAGLLSPCRYSAGLHPKNDTEQKEHCFMRRRKL